MNRLSGHERNTAWMSGSYCLKPEEHQYIDDIDCFFEKTGSTGSHGARAIFNSIIECAYLSCFRNFTTGLQALKGGYIDMASYYSHVENCTTGLYAHQGGQIVGMVNNQYAGNTTDENAMAGSFGYVD
jgi:hypothetical protein